jgi:uncharacterized RDD family membrane protein YckC
VIASAPPAVGYAGLVTRTVAFAADAAVINLVALTVGVVFGLALSIFHIPGEVETALVALGAALWVAWSAGYFIAFWTTTGQTPGSRLMRIRVRDAELDRPLRPTRAALRLVGMMLAAIPLFAGFLRILFDARRRGFHDRLAGSVVVAEPTAPSA